MGGDDGVGEEENRLFGGGILTIDEGLCVQMMHIEIFDDEPRPRSRAHGFVFEGDGYADDANENRLHPENLLVGPERVRPRN